MSYLSLDIVNRNLLIAAQKDYIQFLAEQVKDVTLIANIHGYTCPEEVINKGMELRDKIREYEI